MSRRTQVFFGAKHPLQPWHLEYIDPQIEFVPRHAQKNSPRKLTPHHSSGEYALKMAQTAVFAILFFNLESQILFSRKYTQDHKYVAFCCFTPKFYTKPPPLPRLSVRLVWLFVCLSVQFIPIPIPHFLYFFISLFLKTQSNHWTKRMVNTN